MREKSRLRLYSDSAVVGFAAFLAGPFFAATRFAPPRFAVVAGSRVAGFFVGLFDASFFVGLRLDADVFVELLFEASVFVGLRFEADVFRLSRFAVVDFAAADGLFAGALGRFAVRFRALVAMLDGGARTVPAVGTRRA